MVETREKPEFGRFFLQSPCFSAIFWAAPGHAAAAAASAAAAAAAEAGGGSRGS